MDIEAFELERRATQGLEILHGLLKNLQGELLLVSSPIFPPQANLLSVLSPRFL